MYAVAGQPQRTRGTSLLLAHCRAFALLLETRTASDRLADEVGPELAGFLVAALGPTRPQRRAAELAA